MLINKGSEVWQPCSILVICASGLTVADRKVPLTRPDCLRVDGVQYTSAVLHWKPHSSTRRLNYVVNWRMKKAVNDLVISHLAFFLIIRFCAQVHTTRHWRMVAYLQPWIQWCSMFQWRCTSWHSWISNLIPATLVWWKQKGLVWGDPVISSLMDIMSLLVQLQLPSQHLGSRPVIITWQVVFYWEEYCPWCW